MPEPRRYLLPPEWALPIVARARPEDFVVEELDAFEPSGEGEHALVRIEKRGLSTAEAVRRLALAVGADPREAGHAGLKDARAVALQRVTLARVDPERLRGLELEGLRVLEAERHRAKLQMGHSRGNRFDLLLRGVGAGEAPLVERALGELERRGVPHRFESQRFGHRGDTGAIGLALLTERWDEAAALVAGRPGPRDHGPVLAARERFEAGHPTEAARLWPRSYADARRLCQALARRPDAPREALLSLDRHTLRLYASAAQSLLFNRVLDARMPHPERLLDGDVVRFGDGGSGFVVDDAEREQPRADAFEFSPTGPMFGAKEQRPTRVALALEEEVLREAGLSRAHFARRGPLYCAGTRRALRTRLRAPSVEAGRDALGEFVRVRFELGPGAYATAVLAELGQERLEVVERDAEARA